MKQLFIVLVGLVLFFACKKEAEPEPIASIWVSGTYEVSNIALPGLTLTLPQSASGIARSGILIADRFNNQDDAITVSVILKTTGQQDAPIKLENFTLKANGSSYDVVYDNVTCGTADGTNINLDFTKRNQRYFVVAKR